MVMAAVHTRAEPALYKHMYNDLASNCTQARSQRQAAVSETPTGGSVQEGPKSVQLAKSSGKRK
eukprot:6227521-Amphidinium_carterae.1